MDVAARGKVDEKLLDQHYERLNNLLKKLQNFYQKKVIICIHPQYDLNETKKNFQILRLSNLKQKKVFIMHFLVLFFVSTAILDAFLLKKNIISLMSKIDWLGRPASYYTQYGTTLIDIDSDLNFSKKELDEKFRISKQYYNNFIYDYIITDGDKIGVDKVINYCKAVCNQLNE